MISTVAICLMANAACGYSPLFNHTLPVRTPESVAIESEESLSCRFELKTQDLCADFIWLKEPNREDQGAMKLYFWKKNQVGTYSTPSASTITVQLWMPDMGHGSQKTKVLPVRDAAGAVVPGVFDVSEVFFVMGGNWEIRLQLKDAANVIMDQAKVSYQAQ